jgi:hypothetical protein
MDFPGENDGVIVALSVYHNGIIESVHEPAIWVHSTSASLACIASSNFSL